MSYSRYDFIESLGGGTGINHDTAPKAIDPSTIEKVIAAWGYSSEGYAQWSGGFLMKMKDGRFAYLTGWCDTTGWGCQDGSDITYFDTEPTLESLGKPTEKGRHDNEAPGDWDLEPTDLNKWLADGAKDNDRF